MPRWFLVIVTVISSSGFMAFADDDRPRALAVLAVKQAELDRLAKEVAELEQQLDRPTQAAIRVQMLSVGPLDPRRLWTIPDDGEIWPIAPSDTPGFGGGPIDVTSDGTSSEEDPDPGSDDGFTDCYGCASIARRWKVMLSGVANGTCNECAALNGEHILERNYAYSYCRWTKVASACGEVRIHFIRHWSITQVILVRAGLIIAGYTLLADDFDCHGPNTLPLTNVSDECTNWPASVVLEPAEE